MNFPNLQHCPKIAYDTETTGLSAQVNKVFGFSISTEDRDFWFDIRETPGAVDWFNDQMKTFKGRRICHNLSFDYRMSQATGLNLPLDGQSTDTAINACLINEHEMSFSLDNLSRKYTKSYKKGDDLYPAMAAILGGGKTRGAQMKNISDPRVAHLVGPYACGDTRSTYDLDTWQQGEIKRQGLERIVAFEQSLTPYFVATEQQGLRVDVDAAQIAVGELTTEINTLQKALDRVAGFCVNTNAPKQLQKLFKPVWKADRWWACDGTPLKKTKTGNPSINAEVLLLMKHPAAIIISELKLLKSCRNTFLMSHILEREINGRVYPSIRQNKMEKGGTATGRLAYAEPALQQIPSRNKRICSIVKSVFLPEEGHSWVESDMSSFEVRVWAHLIGTPDIIDVYRKNKHMDFHQWVADLTGLPRKAEYTGGPNAKQLNLSMIFNQGDGTTAEALGLPWEWKAFYAVDEDKVEPGELKALKKALNPFQDDAMNNTLTGDTLKKALEDGKVSRVVYRKAGAEAMKIINQYHKKLPGVKTLQEKAIETAKRRGYLFTRYGRRLRFPDKRKLFQAPAKLIQSNSADENKKNWPIILETIKGTGTKLLLNTHDSYSLSIPKGQELEIATWVKKNIEACRGLRIPLILGFNKPGINWYESYKDDSEGWLV